MAYSIGDANLTQRNGEKMRKNRFTRTFAEEDPEKYGIKRNFQFMLNERIRQMHHLFWTNFRLQYSHNNLKI